MDKHDVAVIERIVRQGWFDPATEENNFESWLGVDQDQAIALIQMIPNREKCNVKLPPWITEDALRKAEGNG